MVHLQIQLCRYIGKVSTQICIMGHYGPWFIALWAPSWGKRSGQPRNRWSDSDGPGELLATGVRHSRSRQVWILLPRFWTTSSALWINTVSYQDIALSSYQNYPTCRPFWRSANMVIRVRTVRIFLEPRPLNVKWRAFKQQRCREECAPPLFQECWSITSSTDSRV